MIVWSVKHGRLHYHGDREGRPYHTTLRFRGGHSYRVGATLAVALVALRQTERKLYDGGKLQDFPE